MLQSASQITMVCSGLPRQNNARRWLQTCHAMALDSGSMGVHLRPITRAIVKPGTFDSIDGDVQFGVTPSFFGFHSRAFKWPDVAKA